MIAKSFNAQVATDCRILILGSMPGKTSLSEQQYYAHPRNAFWPIMQAILGIPSSMNYPQRIDAIKKYGVGLWDVYHQCYRPGSLDAAIDKRSVQFNAIGPLIKQLPNLSCIACNGQTVSFM